MPLTKPCAVCQKPFTYNLARTRAQFCSVYCLSLAKRKNKPCAVCETPVPRGRIGHHRRRWCSLKCRRVERPPQGPVAYRQFLKPSCEKCNSENHLLVHHKDENRQNNSPGNLETLCRACHQAEHGHWWNLYQTVFIMGVQYGLCLSRTRVLKS